MNHVWSHFCGLSLLFIGKVSAVPAPPSLLDSSVVAPPPLCDTQRERPAKICEKEQCELLVCGSLTVEQRKAKMDSCLLNLSPTSCANKTPTCMCLLGYVRGDKGQCSITCDSAENIGNSANVNVENDEQNDENDASPENLLKSNKKTILIDTDKIHQGGRVEVKIIEPKQNQMKGEDKQDAKQANGNDGLDDAIKIKSDDSPNIQASSSPDFDDQSGNNYDELVSTKEPFIVEGEQTESEPTNNEVLSPKSNPSTFGVVDASENTNIDESATQNETVQNNDQDNLNGSEVEQSAQPTILVPSAVFRTTVEQLTPTFPPTADSSVPTDASVSQDATNATVDEASSNIGESSPTQKSMTVSLIDEISKNEQQQQHVSENPSVAVTPQLPVNAEDTQVSNSSEPVVSHAKSVQPLENAKIQNEVAAVSPTSETTLTEQAIGHTDSNAIASADASPVTQKELPGIVDEGSESDSNSSAILDSEPKAKEFPTDTNVEETQSTAESTQPQPEALPLILNKEEKEQVYQASLKIGHNATLNELSPDELDEAVEAITNEHLKKQVKEKIIKKKEKDNGNLDGKTLTELKEKAKKRKQHNLDIQEKAREIAQAAQKIEKQIIESGLELAESSISEASTTSASSSSTTVVPDNLALAQNANKAEENDTIEEKLMSQEKSKENVKGVPSSSSPPAPKLKIPDSEFPDFSTRASPEEKSFISDEFQSNSSSNSNSVASGGAKSDSSVNEASKNQENNADLSSVPKSVEDKAMEILSTSGSQEQSSVQPPLSQSQNSSGAASHERSKRITDEPNITSFRPEQNETEISSENRDDETSVNSVSSSADLPGSSPENQTTTIPLLKPIGHRHPTFKEIESDEKDDAKVEAGLKAKPAPPM